MKNFEPIKQLLDNSGTFYLISVRMDSTYQYLNALYRSVFEPLHGDLVGQHYAVTMHPDDTQTCANVAAACFAHPEKIFPATIRKHDGHGGYIATQWDYKGMFDEHGQPSGIFCIGYDITTFVQTTLALEQIEYVQSHLIRKPLANLMGLVEVFGQSEDKNDQRELMEMIKDSANELDAIVKSGHSRKK